MSRNEKSAAGLDREYQEGRWSFLGNIREMSRHGVIASWLMGTNNVAEVLDVGCGEGHFYKRVEPLGLKRYVGIDLSNEPLKIAQTIIDQKIAVLECADLAEFNPKQGGFNAVVFNEVLNYADDAADQMARYAKFLVPDGVIAISIYAPTRKESGAHKRIEEIWSQIGELNWKVLDDITLVSHIRDLTWRMILVQPTVLD